ncbi:putative arylsulfatase [Hypoxylon cercidicola]|nr:putative arylsulfatase [Hypoxylon cercidicola]
MWPLTRQGVLQRSSLSIFVISIFFAFLYDRYVRSTTMSKEKPPNVLIIVADDLGFSDTSPYGGEIDTPNLQKLADEGIRMTGFHTAASCSPTRAMLLSGTDSHIAGLGCMAEKIRKAPQIFKGKPGYEGYLNYRVAALGEILQDAGYFTFMSGKWHLGLEKTLGPHARGFSKVLSFLPGGGNHFNHEPQLYGLNEKPAAIFKGDGIWMKDGEFINGSTDLPKDFYSSNTFMDHFLDILKERTADERTQPFCGYLPFTAPHWPLQAPQEVIKKYRGKYDDGPIALRDSRLQSLIEKGLVPPDVEPASLHMLNTKPWEEMSDEEKRKSSRAMEVYAAMVDLIDVNIGRVRTYLEETGELDNTFIAFMSDNGAEGQLLEALPVLAGYTVEDIVKKYYDNSLDNIGNYNSFVWYGPQWAGAATAPSRGAKSHSTEGGIHCPCIVRYPPSLRQGGLVTGAFTTVMDIVPTVLDLAGLKHPSPIFRGREVMPVRGKSWRPILEHPEDQSVQIYKDEDVVGWEQLGIAAVRVGDWKALFLPPPKGPGRWELYDLSKDLGEVHDLAESRPEKLKEMLQHYETYFQETGMFDSFTMYQEALKQRRAEKGGIGNNRDVSYVSTLWQSLTFLQERFKSLLKGNWGEE